MAAHSTSLPLANASQTTQVELVGQLLQLLTSRIFNSQFQQLLHGVGVGLQNDSLILESQSRTEIEIRAQQLSTILVICIVTLNLIKYRHKLHEFVV
jgi:hypothetical protein